MEDENREKGKEVKGMINLKNDLMLRRDAFEKVFVFLNIWFCWIMQIHLTPDLIIVCVVIEQSRSNAVPAKCRVILLQIKMCFLL